MVLVIPTEPPGVIRQWLGPPEDLLGYMLLVLLGHFGWNLIDTYLPIPGKQGQGLRIIQETGPGDVQEAV